MISAAQAEFHLSLSPLLGTSYRTQSAQQIVVALGGLKEQQGGLSSWSPVSKEKSNR